MKRKKLQYKTLRASGEQSNSQTGSNGSQSARAVIHRAPPTCSYCHNPAYLVTGQIIYPHRPDLWRFKFWLCAPCEAYVGCHKYGDGTRPLGRLANRELRDAKQAAHTAFDPLWRGRGKTDLTREEAYSWLAEQLEIDRKQCHIGEFDVIQCRKVVAICENRRT
jgi:hypothetical protein